MNRVLNEKGNSHSKKCEPLNASSNYIFIQLLINKTTTIIFLKQSLNF